jgi:hypothetical protein
MENQRDIHNITVTWRGKKFVLEMELSSTLKELGHKLQKLTDVKEDTIRLIIPSKKDSKLLFPFADDQSSLLLQEISIFEGKTVKMMGVPKDEVDQVLQNAKTDLRIAGFDEEEKRSRQRKLDGTHSRLLKLPQGNYIFCDFRTLRIPGLQLTPPASEALKLMHTLAADPGIVAIMNKHRWRVGIMTEMAPEGYVGVSPRCILGFNKNHGEEISLRLRTDDLKGFRKYDSIKKTLLHELAHMVFSEHDANFKALDSQLNQEAASLDWTRSKGHTLSGSKYTQNQDGDFDTEVNSSLPQKLGGVRSTQLANPRASSVVAAYLRLASGSNDERTGLTQTHKPNLDDKSAVEPDPDESETTVKTSGLILTIDEPDIDDLETIVEYSGSILTVDEPDPDDSETMVESSGSILTIAEPDPDDSETMVETSGLILTVNGPDPDDSATMVESSELNLTVDEPDPDDSEMIELDLDDEELKRIQDPVTVICNRLQQAVKMIQSETTVLQTLFKIVRNIIENPNEIKFRKLRKANPLIQRNIANHKGAMEILLLIGFNEELVTDEMGRQETYLVLKRNDPGLLWLAKSSLEKSL